MYPGLVQFIEDFPGNRVTDLYLLDTVEAETDAHRVVAARHPHVEDLAAQAHLATVQVSTGAGILQSDQFAHQLNRLDVLADVNSGMIG